MRTPKPASSLSSHLWGPLTILCLIVGSCTQDAFVNLTTSLGGEVVGGRGQMFGAFINNTPFRAVFTTGGLDPQDQQTVPEIRQFFDSDLISERLEAGATSDQIQLTCAREWAVGTQLLIDLIFRTDQDLGLDPTALGVGVLFFQDDLTDPTLEPIQVGTAQPNSAFLGMDYQCGSLLIFRFAEDATAPGGFRIDLDVILP